MTAPLRALAVFGGLVLATSMLTVGPNDAGAADVPKSREVTGLVLVEPEGGGDPVPATSGWVDFFRTDFAHSQSRRVAIAPDGTFSVWFVDATTYTVAVTTDDGSGVPIRSWYPGAPDQARAQEIALEPDVDRDLGTIVIGSRTVSSDRLSGANRFATAVEVTKAQFRDPGAAPPVYIVNGLNFPDALSAGALAGRDGALLMVGPTSIPPVVAEELERLQPSSITIVGGTGVVSSAVEIQLRSFVDSPSAVRRIAGVDRYDTSRRVLTSPDGFDGASVELYIVTGRDFPDALAAVPPAVVNGGAVLLIDGRRLRLDAATRAVIESIQPWNVNIIGGPGVVSEGIEAELFLSPPVGLGLSVWRYDGANRFETAVEVAQGLFPFGADHAFLANGYSFADALAAGPHAGQLFSPIYLVPPSCMPDPVLFDIIDVLANRVVGVGGTGVLSDAALLGDSC